MNDMTEKEMTDYDAATVCTACSGSFTDTNWKVRHHCHVSGNYLYPACNNCNLQLKTTIRKRKTYDITRKSGIPSREKRARKIQTHDTVSG